MTNFALNILENGLEESELNSKPAIHYKNFTSGY